MSVKAVLIAAALVVAGGGAAATGGVADIGAVDAQPQERPSNVDATATLTNGTVTLVVTDAGSGFEGVNVSVDDEPVGATDANGTVTFAAGNDSELELTLTAPGFEGELEYVVRNGTLVLGSEEYEYAVGDADEDDSEADEEDGEADEENSERDLPEEAADAPGHDGDLPEEAAEEARENSQRRGPPADVPAGADDEDDEAEADEDDEDETEDDEDEDDDEE